MEELIRQHLLLSQQIQQLWSAFVILVFMQLLLVLTMVGLAVWSVASVNTKQKQIEKEWKEVLGILMHNAKLAKQRKNE